MQTCQCRNMRVGDHARMQVCRCTDNRTYRCADAPNLQMHAYKFADVSWGTQLREMQTYKYVNTQMRKDGNAQRWKCANTDEDATGRIEVNWQGNAGIHEYCRCGKYINMRARTYASMQTYGWANARTRECASAEICGRASMERDGSTSMPMCEYTDLEI
jgi:hypothetical protein